MKINKLTCITLVFWTAFADAQTTSAEYFKHLSFAELQNNPISAQPIDGIRTAFPAGSILAYETNAHRTGKMLVRKSGYDLIIDWVTYEKDGKVYRSGQGTTVKGTYQFDLDDKSNQPEAFDFWWEQVDTQQRYLVPKNGSKFGKVVVEAFTEDNNALIRPYSLKKVKLSNNVEISYADEGKESSDYTLLFIHGLGGYHQVWKKNIDELRKSYRCIALDLPGCGVSSKSDYPFSVHFYADVTAEFIASLRLKNVVLVGHSLGGQVAIMTALKNIYEVKKLVLLAPSGLQIFSESEKNGIEWLASPQRTKTRTDKQLTTFFQASYATRKIPSDAEFMLKYRLNLKKNPDYFDYFCNMNYKLSMAAANEPVLDQLSDIKVPTLLLWGKEDIQISPNLAETAKRHIPDCDVYLLSPCGHLFNWECAEEVNTHIGRFLQPIQNDNQKAPVALFIAEPTRCIAPCTVKLTNQSQNADRFVWMVGDKVVSREKEFIYTLYKVQGYRIKLIAYKGDNTDEYETMVRGLGE